MSSTGSVVYLDIVSNTNPNTHKCKQQEVAVPGVLNHHSALLYDICLSGSQSDNDSGVHAHLDQLGSAWLGSVRHSTVWPNPVKPRSKQPRGQSAPADARPCLAWFIMLHSVHVFVDLLKERMQRGLRLRLLDLLDQLGVLGDELPEVGHFL